MSAITSSGRGGKYWGVTAVVVLVGSGVWSFLHRPPATVLLTSTVTRGNIERSVLAGGIIEPRKLVSVGAQASGRILALHVTLGDHVRKGDLIAEIDPSTEVNALAAAQTTLDQARAQRAVRSIALRQLELAWRRARITYPLEASSQADYESREAEYKEAREDVIALKAAVKNAQLNVDTARVTLGFTKVTAPMDGTVVAILAGEGETVNAVQSAPTIIKLADLSVMTVKAQVSEADVIWVRPGQSVYFTIFGDPSKRYAGTLRALEPAPDSIAAPTETTGAAAASATSSSTAGGVYYNALFDVPNINNVLRPSMTAEVHIVLGAARSVLTVPRAALGPPLADGYYEVKVANKDGHKSVRRVSIGLENSTVAEVREGLTEGEAVVVREETIENGLQKPPGFP